MIEKAEKWSSSRVHRKNFVSDGIYFWFWVLMRADLRGNRVGLQEGNLQYGNGKTIWPWMMMMMIVMCFPGNCDSSTT
jgi:hypothetical protein